MRSARQKRFQNLFWHTEAETLRKTPMNTDATLSDCKASMQKALDHTLNEFSTLNTGKANPSMVESLSVECYGGSAMKLLEIAAITTPDNRTIRIEPWDKSVMKDIEKAIQSANLGLYPVIDGGIIRCPIPELSKERRKELVKVAGQQAEQGRVGIRAARRDAMDSLKKAQKESEITEDDLKRLEKDVQKLTDDFTGQINEQLAGKEKDLMQV